MSRSIPINLQFLANQNKGKEGGLQAEVLESAAEIVKLCQAKLSQVDDEKTKLQLNHLIVTTGQIIHDLSTSKDSTEARNQRLDLQLTALQLPQDLLKKPKMSSLSYSIAMACVFILVLSVAITLGFVFHALVFNYYTGKMFFEALMDGLAGVGIPATILGLFSYGLSILTDNPHEGASDEKGMFDSLQSEINNFCDLAQTEDNDGLPFHDVASPKHGSGTNVSMM